ncbi:MAG: sigma-70 family RNA polymerase sigma factor [Planctomycetes bacterium]|nr:sigma-70 family RNA polymerase sigma factor [Planctomycetota bacterium]
MDRQTAEQLQRARAGDVEAFAYVATAFREQLVAWARPFTMDAEDAAQEALLVAYAKLGELREPEAFAGWLRVLVRSAAIRQSRRRRPDALEPAEAPVEEMPNAAESRELQQAVHGAVRELTPALAAVIEAHYMRGEKLEEIAHALNLPLGTVKRRLFEAREKLRTMLAGHWTGGDDEWRG